MERNHSPQDLNAENPQNVRFAGFWIRVAATLVDGLVFLPLALLGVYNFLFSKILVLAILYSSVNFIYKPLMEYHYGATVGKMVVKIKVVNLSFGRITFNQAFLRFGFNFLVIFAGIFSTINMFSIPEFQEVHGILELSAFQEKHQSQDYMSSAASFFYMVSVMMVAFDLQRQGLHDKIALTYCVYK